MYRAVGSLGGITVSNPKAKPRRMCRTWVRQSITRTPSVTASTLTVMTLHQTETVKTVKTVSKASGHARMLACQLQNVWVEHVWCVTAQLKVQVAIV